MVLLVLLVLPCVSGVFIDSWVRLKGVCVNEFGHYCSDQAYVTAVDPENVTVLNESACVNVALGLYSCDVFVNKTGVWWVGINFTDQNLSQSYNVVVRGDEEDVGGSMIVGVIALLPLLLGFLLVLGSRSLSDEHSVLKVFLLLFSFPLFFAGMYLGVTGLDDLGVSGDLGTNSAYTVQIVAYIMGFAIIGYFVVFSIYRIFMHFRGKREKLFSYGGEE